MADIPIRNIFHLLSYAYRDLRLGHYTALGSEAFDHIHDLLAAILVIATKQLLSQGLAREYVPVHEVLSTVRGRIDMIGTLAERRNQRLRVSCRHDEYNPDHVLNQIIKSTLLLLVRQTDVLMQQRQHIKRIVLHLDGISTIDLHRVRWDILAFRPHTQRYEMPVAICRLVVEGLLLHSDDHGIRMRQVLDEQQMALLYERFVRAYYLRHFPALKPRSTHIEWAVDCGDPAQLPRMKTDTVLSNPAQTLLIDTKYYGSMLQQQHDRASLHSQHLYQLYAYVHNSAARSQTPVSGLLLYAKTTAGPAPATDATIAGRRLAAWAVDLSGEFDAISGQLDRVVERFFDVTQTAPR